MSDEPKAKRLSRLADDIGYALGRGEYPENDIRQYRWLWRTTPDQEKDGLSLTLQNIEEMVADMRREQAVIAGAGKIRRTPITTGRIDGDL